MEFETDVYEPTERSTLAPELCLDHLSITIKRYQATIEALEKQVAQYKEAQEQFVKNLGKKQSINNNGQQREQNDIRND